MVKKYFLGSFVCPYCQFAGYESVDSLKLHIKWVHKFDALGDYFVFSINEFFFHNLIERISDLSKHFFLIAESICDDDGFYEDVIANGGMGNYFFGY